MTLIILAAGMGSRYGGLKQVDTVGPKGESILDYSVYDAIEAGFDRVVFIIKKEHRDIFEEKFGKKIRPYIDVEYAFQDINDIPSWVKIPAERTKPWGTAHALLTCRDIVKDDFLVLNADDYYGKESFAIASEFLKNSSYDGKSHFCMAGYIVKNTLTENGFVTRGVCKCDDNGYLVDITETQKIGRSGGRIVYIDDNGNECELADDTVVSMNFFALTPHIFDTISEGIEKFFKANEGALEKCEYYLPVAVKEAMDAGTSDVKVIPTTAKWYGVTYREDRQSVVDFFAKAHGEGLYNKYWMA